MIRSFLQNLKERGEIRKALSYLIVGGGATLVEWFVFWILNPLCHVQYLLSTCIAYVVSTFANWVLGRLITFRSAGKQNVAKELLLIYLSSVIGILLNLLIMWLLVDRLGFAEMLSKMIATGLVFFYNYLIRRLFIYKA